MLCFAFGIELDDVVSISLRGLPLPSAVLVSEFVGFWVCACAQTTEKAIIRKEKHLDDDGDVEGDDEVIYKIEVPANRSVEFVLVNGIDAAGYPANENR